MYFEIDKFKKYTTMIEQIRNKTCEKLNIDDKISFELVSNTSGLLKRQNEEIQFLQEII